MLAGHHILATALRGEEVALPMLAEGHCGCVHYALAVEDYNLPVRLRRNDGGACAWEQVLVAGEKITRGIWRELQCGVQYTLEFDNASRWNNSRTAFNDSNPECL